MAERRRAVRTRAVRVVREPRRAFKHPAPRLLPGTPEFDPVKKLTVAQVERPLPNATLGDLGLATRVSGADEFPLTVLIQPYDRAALTGLDRASIRTFRYDPGGRMMRLVASSGINLE